MQLIGSLFTTLLGAILLAGCLASTPPNVANICEIFDDRRSWYKAAIRSREEWDIPVAVNMAFIYQESSFQARAKPERGRFLWIFPGRRPSSAYGYAQAVDGTWQDYVDESGNSRARRNDFEDAIDFVGWYNAMSRRINDIPPEDAASLYFAYHEGNAGFARGAHWRKPWLVDTASRVQRNAERFQAQYEGCREELERNWFQRLFT